MGPKHNHPNRLRCGLARGAVVLSDAVEVSPHGEHTRTLLVGLQSLEQSLNSAPWKVQEQASPQDLKNERAVEKVKTCPH